MDRYVGAAAMPGSDRKDLAVQALARSATVSDLSARHGVSRKFVYQQANKARCALDDAFISAATDDTVLFEIPVTKRWLRQVIVALALTCRGSYLGILEFMRDVLGWSISIGTVHNVLHAAAEQARVINGAQDLSRIRTGLHDELFHGGKPVLAGVCAESTYCYLLAAAEHRDADTWGVHLLDVARQGLRPDYTIADAGQGLRAGQKAAWDDTPCHGDVFHIIRQCEGLANTLSRIAKGARSRREKQEAKFGRAGQLGPKEAAELALARRAETRALELARGIRTLIQWLSHDVLALAGPNLATRRELFDFITDELQRLEPEDVRRIHPVRVALRNQRDDLLAFAGVLDKKLAGIARTLEISQSLVREACMLHRLPNTATAYWERWNRLRAKMGDRAREGGAKFRAVLKAVSRIMARTPRSSSLVENLNSRLRNYFTLRRHLGNAYLDLLRFFLNHRRYMRSQLVERVGKSPRELMTGEHHPHWLALLGLGPLQNQSA
jgi:hypothetical protein